MHAYNIDRRASIIMLHNADANDDHSILASNLVALERSIPEFGESQCLEVGEYSILVELIEGTADTTESSNAHQHTLTSRCGQVRKVQSDEGLSQLHTGTGCISQVPVLPPVTSFVRHNAEPVLAHHIIAVGEDMRLLRRTTRWPKHNVKLPSHIRLCNLCIDRSEG